MPTKKSLAQAFLDRREESGYNPFANPGGSSPQMGSTDQVLKTILHPYNTAVDWLAYQDPQSAESQAARDFQNQFNNNPINWAAFKQQYDQK